MAFASPPLHGNHDPASHDTVLARGVLTVLSWGVLGAMQTFNGSGWALERREALQVIPVV